MGKYKQWPERKSINFNKNLYDALLLYKEKNNLPSISKTLEFLIKKYAADCWLEPKPKLKKCAYRNCDNEFPVFLEGKFTSKKYCCVNHKNLEMSLKIKDRNKLNDKNYKEKEIKNVNTWSDVIEVNSKKSNSIWDIDPTIDDFTSNKKKKD